MAAFVASASKLIVPAFGITLVIVIGFDKSKQPFKSESKFPATFPVKGVSYLTYQISQTPEPAPLKSNGPEFGDAKILFVALSVIIYPQLAPTLPGATSTLIKSVVASIQIVALFKSSETEVV